MLTIAWTGSIVLSSPQVFLRLVFKYVIFITKFLFSSFIRSIKAFIFHVESHPKITWYQQCVTYHFFKNELYETLYSIMGMLFMYALPLIIIIFTYASIYIEIFRKSRSTIAGKSITYYSI